MHRALHQIPIVILRQNQGSGSYISGVHHKRYGRLREIIVPKDTSHENASEIRCF